MKRIWIIESDGEGNGWSPVRMCRTKERATATMRKWRAGEGWHRSDVKYRVVAYVPTPAAHADERSERGE